MVVRRGRYGTRRDHEGSTVPDEPWFPSAAAALRSVGASRRSGVSGAALDPLALEHPADPDADQHQDGERHPTGIDSRKKISRSSIRVRFWAMKIVTTMATTTVAMNFGDGGSASARTPMTAHRAAPECNVAQVVFTKPLPLVEPDGDPHDSSTAPSDAGTLAAAAPLAQW